MEEKYSMALLSHNYLWRTVKWVDVCFPKDQGSRYSDVLAYECVHYTEVGVAYCRCQNRRISGRGSRPVRLGG